MKRIQHWFLLLTALGCFSLARAATPAGAPPLPQAMPEPVTERTMNLPRANADTSAAPAPAPAPTPTPAPAINPVTGNTTLDAKPARGADEFPKGGDQLLNGLVAEARISLIFSYYASGTLGDALIAGLAGNITDPPKLAADYAQLTKGARDGLADARNAYVLGQKDYVQLDQLLAAYDSVTLQVALLGDLAKTPMDEGARANFKAAQRRSFIMLQGVFADKPAGAAPTK